MCWGNLIKCRLQKDTWAISKANGHIGRQEDRRADKKTDGQTGEKMDRQEI